MPVSMCTCFQSRISGPWSQVSERRSVLGKLATLAASGGATCSGLYPWGRERFRDSDALILHGQNMASLMDAIMATANVSGELLGDRNERLREQLADSPVGLFALYQSL